MFRLSPWVLTALSVLAFLLSVGHTWYGEHTESVAWLACALALLAHSRLSADDREDEN